MPDKFIYLKRTVPFVHDQINSDAMQEQLAMTRRSIGSYFASKSSTKLGTGLTPDEEKLLLPPLLHVGVDASFFTHLTKFYTDINTVVPGGRTGLKLNIGLTDATKPLSADNLPLNLMDYIRYRHAMGYPNTAPSAEAAKGNSIIEFYVEDPDKVIESKFNDSEMRDRAMSEFLKIKTDPERVNMTLSILKTYIRKEAGRPPVVLSQLGEKEKVVVLRDIAIMRPDKFYETCTDKDIKKKYFVEECLSTGILSRMGNSIVDTTDSNKHLASTVNELVILLSNPGESLRLNRLRAEYDDRKSRSKVIA